MDRIRIQVQYKRVLWTCPVCKIEEPEDRPMNGGASYEHTCKNGHKFNQSAGAMREFNSTLNYTPEEYEKKTEQDITDAKDIAFAKFVYDMKNPPPYIEPTKEQLEAEKEAKLQEIASLDSRIQEAQAKEVKIG